MITSNISTINVSENNLKVGLFHPDATTRNPDAYGQGIDLWCLEHSSTFMNSNVITTDYWHSSSDIRWVKYDTPLTNIDWVERCFSLLSTYASSLPSIYYPFMLQEELFHPSIQAAWWHNSTGIESRTDKSLKTWKTTWTPRELANTGIVVECIRDFYNKKGLSEPFDTFWTRESTKLVDGHTSQTNNPGNYTHPIVWEWSVDYGLKLHKAWHIRCHQLGKKSAITGFCGIPTLSESQLNSGMSGANDVLTWYYPGSLGQYILQNYDLLFVYQYPDYITTPTSSPKTRPVKQSVNMVKYIRNTLGYKNHLSLFLTVLWGDGNGTFDPIVQKNEFMSCAPYVSSIVSSPYAKVEDTWRTPITSENMTKRLIPWKTEYNNL